MSWGERRTEAIEKRCGWRECPLMVEGEGEEREAERLTHRAIVVEKHSPHPVVDFSHAHLHT